MKILVLDNYDSFTYNLVQYIQEIVQHKVAVFRNDAISLEAVGQYDKIILSPGPGVPKDAGIMPKLIKKYASSKHILGVCLGHQAIGEAFGGTLHNIEKVYHGVATPVNIVDGKAILFKGLPSQFEVGRYHSWVVEKINLPKNLQVTAIDKFGTIMAMQHRIFNVHGVQFHPESVMTPHGKAILNNFLYQASQANFSEDLIAESRGLA